MHAPTLSPSSPTTRSLVDPAFVPTHTRDDGPPYDADVVSAIPPSGAHTRLDGSVHASLARPPRATSPHVQTQVLDVAMDVDAMLRSDVSILENASVARDAAEPHSAMGTPALLRLATHSASEDTRRQAIDALGGMPDVSAVRALLTLTQEPSFETRSWAGFVLSPASVGMLVGEARCDPDEADACLRDLVLYAPENSSVPQEALWALVCRAEARSASVCAALAHIAEYHTGPMGQQAYMRLRHVLTFAQADTNVCLGRLTTRRVTAPKQEPSNQAA